MFFFYKIINHISLPISSMIYKVIFVEINIVKA